MAEMTKRERVMAAIAGAGVDRVPFSFWYHFPVEDKAGEEFIQLELEFARKYDVDILKIMHDIPYELPAGLERVTKPEDWLKLEPLDPRTGNFGRHLQALHAIRKGLPDDRPMVDTIFSPFSIADKLTGKQTLRLMREDPESLQKGLSVIAQSLADFARAAIEDGAIDGMFLASSGGQTDMMTEAEFRTHLLGHHKVIADACEPVGTCNVLHIHGTNLLWDVQAQMPAQIVNWSDRTSAPSLSEARAKDGRCFAGGINEVNAHLKTPEQIRDEARSAIEELGGRKMIVACGCAVATDIAEENLLAVKDAICG